ncbi:M20 family metallopeptidase [Microbacterium horticulturae]|uniref:M20 family metallopeptidase n=1 Tax=Microbacterium horticulturae TaxID=3028316 RepID=A0ABY8C1I2_9MICO|nr:M20 family metallopeptidase [Microbacterium sp. KACC 23027]WEG08698.1 M20 family metallopeptidase [Microbacterium sp. KACC 23027]
MDDIFDADSRMLTDRLVAVRRELHAQPEVGLDLPATQKVILRELAGLGMEIMTGRSLSSVTAVLRGARPGPAVLLRADMDALPIAERSEVPYASHNGAMHACGHDLHMAGLLGAARLLATRRDELAGTVVFAFQPGEEGFAGGRMMIEEGLVTASGTRPVAAYATHVDCETPRGRLITRPGPMMASASGMKMSVRGTGGHAARPHQAVDPVPVAAEIILAVQTFAARRIAATDPAVISITRLHSDAEAGNVLAGTVDLEANIRTLSPTALETVRTDLPALVTAIAEAHGCRVDVQFIDSYPVTVNDPSETEWVLSLLDERPEDVVRLAEPSMASEDFAYILEEIPGTLVFFGVEPEGGSAPLHSDRARFDDTLLATQAAIMAQLAWRRLERTADS